MQNVKNSTCVCILFFFFLSSALVSSQGLSSIFPSSSSFWNNQFQSQPSSRSPFGNSANNIRRNNGGFGNNFQGNQQQNVIYTAIGFDRMDPNSQMRISITPSTVGNQRFMMGSSWNQPMRWYVQGTFLGSVLANAAGEYHVVLTENGRTRDGCDAVSLGRVMTSVQDRYSPFAQRPGAAPSMTGVLPDKLMMGSGTTVYASRVEGITREQLAGAGLAACQFVNNGYCSGKIAFCGTITKDNLPAMEVPSSLGPNAMSGGGMPGTQIMDLSGSLMGGGGQGMFGQSNGNDMFGQNNGQGGQGMFGQSGGQDAFGQNNGQGSFGQNSPSVLFSTSQTNSINSQNNAQAGTAALMGDLFG